MRLNDPADPANTADLRQRIAAAWHARHEAQRRNRARHVQLKKIGYHATRAAKRLQSTSAVVQAEAREEWHAIAAAVEQAVGGGDVYPSDSELRELLRPALAA